MTMYTVNIEALTNVFHEMQQAETDSFNDPTSKARSSKEIARELAGIDNYDETTDVLLEELVMKLLDHGVPYQLITVAFTAACIAFEAGLKYMMGEMKIAGIPIQ